MANLILGPRIGARDENVSQSTTGHHKGQNWWGVSVENLFFSPFLFWMRPLNLIQDVPVCKTVHTSIRRSDLPVLNIKWSITQILFDFTLKPSNYKQLRKICMFPAQKSKCPRHFSVVDLEILHTCSTCPSRNLTYGEGSFPLFRRIYSVVLSTHVYVHKCLGECRIIPQSGSCTPRPPRLLFFCFPLHRRQISSDITSSPLSSTASKT